MSDDYIEKLEELLASVESSRFDDMNIEEWKELTTHILKGAIAREGSYQKNDEISSVGARIRKIRKDLGYSMEQFAKAIDDNAKSGTVSNWETGRNLPNNERIKRIAELGGFSVRYLLSGSRDSKRLGEKIRQIRLRNGLTMEEFGEQFNPVASKGIVSNWENGYNNPHPKRLKRIAELGGITVEELLEG